MSRLRTRTLPQQWSCQVAFVNKLRFVTDCLHPRLLCTVWEFQSYVVPDVLLSIVGLHHLLSCGAAELGRWGTFYRERPTALGDPADLLE